MKHYTLTILNDMFQLLIIQILIYVSGAYNKFQD
jgi:hypothetical protein